MTPALRLLPVFALAGGSALLAQPAVTSLNLLAAPSGFEAIRPQDINNHGEITGNARVAGGEWEAIRYSTATGMTSLSRPDGASITFAAAINNQGAVAGYFNDVEWNDFGAVWPAGSGAPTSVGIQPGGFYSYAEDINDNGVAVGMAQLAGGQDRAFVWTATGGMTLLPTFGGTFGIASAINSQGLVAGSASKADGYNLGFIWNGTSLQTLQPHPSNVGFSGPTFFSGSSEATAINDHGQAVGKSSGLNGTMPVRWENGEAIFLGSLDKLDDDNGLATDINNHGVIVGASYLSTNFLGAFVYVDGVMYALNDLAAPFMSDGTNPGFTSLTSAAAINDLGQIVGYGDYWNGVSNNPQGFVLNLAAVPEPSSFALLAGAAALGCVATRRRRR